MSKVIYEGKQYSAYRPTYSERIYSFIDEYHRKNNGNYDFALDVGTGTGKVASQLAEKYKQVYGIDSLEDMLVNAEKKDNIVYKLGKAEELPAENGSVDLVTVGTAFHWFNHEAFFAEAKRVLKPTGTLAIFTYFHTLIKDNTEASNVIITLMSVTLADYFDAKYIYAEALYQNIDFPFENQEWYITPSSKDIHNRSKSTGGPLMEARISIGLLRSQMKTSSAYINYMKDNKQASDPVDTAMEKIKDILKLSSEEDEVDVEWAAALVLMTNSPQ